MRIAIFTNNYLPNPYGVSSSIESFRQELEKLGHTVYIFAPRWKGYVDDNKNTCPPENFSNKNFGWVFRYPSLDIKFKFRFPLPISYSPKMDVILEKLEIDIIHSQHPDLLGSAAMRWAKKKNVPLIFTWHTLYDQYVHFIPVIPKKISAWWIIRRARLYADKCDQVIVPTPTIKKIIQNWGVKNKNIIAIPTGVEIETFENYDRKLIRAKYDIQDDEILLLVVARLTEEKNILFLFEPIADILKNNSKVKFIVVGDGYLRAELENFAQKNDVGNQIFFAGVVLRSEIRNYYAASDIFVFSSKSETQGMILTEAMYMNLPIVAVNATGACDIVLQNKTGFLVAQDKKEFSQAVEKLIESKSLREDFAREAGKIAQEEYTSEACTKKLLQIYTETIEKNNNKKMIQ